MNDLLNVKKILNDKDCQTLKNILRNIDSLNYEEKITVIKSFLIILNSPKIDKISIDDMNIFMNLVEGKWDKSYELFIKKDKYYEKDRELKNIFYKYIIETFYMTDYGVEIFGGESSDENHIKRQLMFFYVIQNTGSSSYLKKMKLFQKISIKFNGVLAQNIQDYINNLQLNLSKNCDKVIWDDSNMQVIEEKSLLKRVNIICNSLDCDLGEININKDNKNNKNKIQITSVNESGIKSDFYSSFQKKCVLDYYSIFLNANFKNKDLKELKELRSIFNIEECYFYDKVLILMEKNLIYDALKESILFLEYFLRKMMPEAGEIKVKYDKSLITDKKNKFISFLNYIKNNQESWDENDILLDTLYLKKEFSNFIDNNSEDIKKKSYLFHDLLMIASENLLITKSNKVFLQYVLLNDNHEGLNLRNEIFHALKNEYHYYVIEVKENMDMIFNLIIFYILSLIINSRSVKGP